jgi:uncharacterized membrane protein YgcG
MAGAVLVFVDGSNAMSKSDSAPPTLQQPADVVVPATYACFQNFCATINLTSFAVSDPDDSSDQITVVCNVPNGSTSSFALALGTLNLTCQAHDPAGNLSPPVSFQVTVIMPPPVFQNVPGPLTFPAQGAAGGVATYVPPTAIDLGGQADPVTCDHPSGVTYPVGTTTVSCSTAVVRGGNTLATASTQFTITITAQTSGGGGSGGGGSGGGGGGGGGSPDTTPPTLAEHPNIAVAATSPSGTTVSYQVNASDPDNAAAEIVTTCSPAPGSVFSLGRGATSSTSVVTCTANDPAGNRAAQMTFQVRILGVHDQIVALEHQLRAATRLSTSTKTILINQLVRADRTFAGGSRADARQMLKSFKTRLLRLPSSLSRTPTVWIATTTRILRVLG